MPVQDLNVSLVQSAIEWHNAGKNWQNFEQMLNGVNTDLVVLPEMFNVGFTQHPDKAAEPMNGPTIKWMKQLAATLNAAVTGSLAVIEKGKYFNRMIFVTPDGELSWYDKRHLFRMAGEHLRYGGGEQLKIIEWRGWRINLQVCYDLRFPVWTRRTQGEGDYDLLIYVANWPSIRRHAWTSLLTARAIENLSYVVGVNRVGEDKNQQHYSGDSMLIDFVGATLWTHADHPMVETQQLSADKLTAFRNSFPTHLDADEFNLKL